MAKRANGGANRINTNTPKTPPITCAQKLVYKASSALPCLAMTGPSIRVAMEAGAPGILNRMAETLPPATELVYTAPSIISDVVGGI